MSIVVSDTVCVTCVACADCVDCVDCVDCDCNFYRNAKVVVVGNESAAVDGAITLTKDASEVTLICKELTVSEAMRKPLGDSSAARTRKLPAALLTSTSMRPNSCSAR